MPIESGPTASRRNRAWLWAFLLLGLGGWFAYDGFAGYENANREELRRTLVGQSDADLRGDPQITDKLAGKSLDDIKATVGKDPAVRLPTESRYFGIDGYLSILNEGDRRAQWVRLPHSATDILLQKMLAAGLAVAGLVGVVMAARVSKSRMVLDDAGLHAASRKVIAWDAMTALSADEFERRGWVDLMHARDGRPQRLRLDSYDLAEFDALIDEICRRKQFPNPLPPADGPDAAGPSVR